MGRRRAVMATCCQLEVRAGTGDVEEHPVVSVVVAEPADLAQTQAVAVKRDDFLEPIDMPGNPQLHASIMTHVSAHAPSGRPRTDCCLRRRTGGGDDTAAFEQVQRRPWATARSCLARVPGAFGPPRGYEGEPRAAARRIAASAGPWASERVDGDPRRRSDDARPGVRIRRRRPGGARPQTNACCDVPHRRLRPAEQNPRREDSSSSSFETLPCLKRC
jgi:hypothetical protein